MESIWSPLNFRFRTLVRRANSALNPLCPDGGPHSTIAADPQIGALWAGFDFRHFHNSTAYRHSARLSRQKLAAKSPVDTRAHNVFLQGIRGPCTNP